MKKLMVVLLLCTMAAAQQDEKVTVSKSMLTKDQIAQLQREQAAQGVHDWAGIGHEIGTAVNESMAAITTQSNNFAQTPVGKLTAFVVIWKLIGADLVHIILGIAFFLFCSAIWLWSYRRICMDKRVLVKQGVDEAGKKYKQWEVVRYDWKGEMSPRAAHWLTAGVLILITLVTVFSF